MLQLEGLELVGFKSFAGKTKVFFPERITAIIGPNGCGKSNLFDAIGWVLGEQSARSLRGQKMDEFIFGGTKKKKRSGLAEVRLHLKRTGEGPLVLAGVELDTDEVEVSRRLYRSGESHYFVNQRRCRLMDVQKFLEDSGLGYASYAMIAQGKIDSFLTAKPLERRQIIEEAAQITGYKSKRRNAEVKLELAQQNLLRVNDIVIEIERQLRSLKRQANKAERYRRLKDEFRQVQRQRFAIEFDELNGSVTRLGALLAELKGKEASVSGQLRRHEAFHRVALGRREKYEAELSKLQEKRSQVSLDLDRTQNSVRYHEEQVSQTKDSLKVLSLEVATLEKSLAAIGEEWDRFQNENATLAQEETRAAEEVDQRKKVAEEQSARLEKAENELEELRSKLVRIAAETASSRNLEEQLSLRVQRLKGEAERLQEERTRAWKQLETHRSLAGEKKLLLENLRTQLLDLEETVSKKRVRQDQLGTELDDLTAQEGDLKGRLVGFKERLQSLQELELTRAQYSEGVQKVLKHLNESKVFSTGGTLADSIETSPEFERVIEQVLDEELEYVLVDSLDQAVLGLSELRKLESGKCTFLSIYSTNGFGKPRRPGEKGEVPYQEEGVYGTLADIIEMKPEVEEAFLRVLPQHAESIVVSDIDRALGLAHSFPESTFITLGGESLTPRGLAAGAAPGSGKLGLLSLKRQKRELEGKVRREQRALAKATEAKKAKKEELGGAIAELGECRNRLYQVEKKAIGLGHEYEQFEAEVRREERAVATVDSELERIDFECAELTQKLNSLGTSVADQEAQRVRTEGDLKAGRERLTELRRAFSDAQDQVNSAAAVRKVLGERRVALAGTLERIRAQRSDTESRLRMTRLREEQSGTRLNDLAQEIEVLRARVEALTEESKQAEISLEEGQEQFSNCKRGLQEVDEQLQELREQKEAAQSARSKVDVEHARVETLMQNLEAQCLEHLRLPIAEAIQGVDFDATKRGEILEQYQTLSVKLENFGPINMTALTEYQEHQERYEFLTRQREDLEKSIADTTKAIQEINRRSRALFSEAFEAVNLNFREVFQKLFGGGDCGMRLLDEEEILECGIDIYAQPPGKRLQNVMLLSGGEKALTVFALLMGIFMFRPSRFCVLDEVDAPLDDANVRRFGELVEEMSKETQFIVVTHNKKTMEMARTLHGVTMEEPGVSKIISAQI